MANYFLIGLVAFLCESIDSSLGMGYGTLLTPILLFMGYEPLQIVPLILLSEFITGILSAFMHHKIGNVNLQFGSKGFRIALILAVCSIIGTVIATFCALSINPRIIKGYIAFLLMLIGVSAYICSHKQGDFSWSKIFILGIIASFNKGLSGGGYGPLVTGGQLVSGLDSKKAVGITSLSEGLTCLIGIIAYFTLDAKDLDWLLGTALIIGALLSIPISVNIVKKIKETYFKKIISGSVLVLGLFTFIKTFNHLISYQNLPIIIASIIITIPFAYYFGQKNILNSKQIYHDN
ncbi:MAG: sulfite exporter TauE/SafE family protein [Firmicutes bacterium]|nr:sulfite exporter TauE/SafE family protein [Bacillota bacterium]